MTLLRIIPTRLSSVFSGWRFSSLSTSIVVAMCAGLLLPALTGGMILTGLTQKRMNRELDTYLNDKILVLANSLPNQVWNYDTNATKAIVEASLLDPQVVRITIKTNNTAQPLFLSIELPERRLGQSRIAGHKLELFGEVVGRVELELDDGLKQREFQQDRLAYSLVFLGQFALALVLILYAIRIRVLKPLSHLTISSNRLAKGDLEQPIVWDRQDEIGHLSRQMDRMRKSLRTSFSEQQAILSNVQVGVIFVRDQKIQLANRHAEQIFGYPPGEMQGLIVSVIYQSDEQLSAIESRSGTAITGIDGRYEKELRLKRRDGSLFWARISGCVLDATLPQAGSIWVYEDITLKKSAADEIEKLAFYDPLTLLPNRRLLMDRLRQALSGSARHGRHGALLFLDLDQFKTLNDTLGHDKGDLLLQQVAKRLAMCIREGDSLSRLGGDEFVIILENLSGNTTEAAAQTQSVGEKIMATLSQPYQLGIYEQHSTTSIGIALFDDMDNRESAMEDLLKQADLALYKAKGAGRNTLRFFDPEMQAVVTARAALESGLREAVLKNELRLHYQVQVDTKGGKTGAEALVRWQHPNRGMVSPAEFIPLAEETGLILPIGRWVLETACTQLAKWALQPKMAHLTIAVNVSARQLHHRDFVEQVLGILDHTGARPQHLKLELTESLLVHDVEETISKMCKLKAKGVSFSLDDFGTGYSSLSYLKRLPLDQLKIDQGFVRDILTDPNDASIAKMVVILAESLGLAVIAEGVETEQQRTFLAEQGCHAYQGYLFSHPLSLEAFEVFMQQGV